MFVEHNKITAESDYFKNDGVHLNSDGNIAFAKDLLFGIESLNAIPDFFNDCHSVCQHTQEILINSQHLLHSTNHHFILAASVHFKRAIKVGDSLALGHYNCAILFIKAVIGEEKFSKTIGISKCLKNGTGEKLNLPSFISNFRCSPQAMVGSQYKPTYECNISKIASFHNHFPLDQNPLKTTMNGTIPCHLMKNEIVDFIDKNLISLISGETGCGKKYYYPSAFAKQISRFSYCGVATEALKCSVPC